MNTISTEAARRLFLSAQGLLADPARKATRATLAKLIEQMGFVQIDSINYVERAHHLTLGSRLDDYDREHFTRISHAAPTKLLTRTTDLFYNTHVVKQICCKKRGRGND